MNEVKRQQKYPIHQNNRLLKVEPFLISIYFTVFLVIRDACKKAKMGLSYRLRFIAK